MEITGIHNSTCNPEYIADTSNVATSYEAFLSLDGNGASMLYLHDCIHH
jgi:hypothetical protein